MDKIKLDGFKGVGTTPNKKQILLSNTCRNFNDYVSSLKYRYDGNNKKIPHYIIDKKGTIYQLLDNSEYSRFFPNRQIGKHQIIISFENLGWLEKKPMSNYYINWIGNIYKEEPYSRKWRDYVYWDRYTEEQYKSCVMLCSELCEDLDIPYKFMEHNVITSSSLRFNGILTRSNFSSEYTDISAAFDFNKLKNI